MIGKDKMGEGLRGIFKVFLCAAAVSFSSPLAQAAIALEPDFEGTVIITSPEGEISVIQPGDPIPHIPNGATLTVSEGQFTVKTDPGDSVSLLYLGHSGVVANGAVANLSSVQDSAPATLKVLNGSVAWQNDEGKKSVLPVGAQYPILPQGQTEKEAPPTGAGEPVGFAPIGGDVGQPPPVDSRGIQASP